MGFKKCDLGFVVTCMGSKRDHLKTHANSSIRICKLLKPMQIALRYSESMASPFWCTSVSCERHWFQEVSIMNVVFAWVSRNTIFEKSIQMTSKSRHQGLKPMQI